MQIQLGDGTTAEITSIENIDLDNEVVYFEGERLTEASAEAIARDIAARHGRKGRTSPTGQGNQQARATTPARTPRAAPEGRAPSRR